MCFRKSGCLLIIPMCCGFDAPILLPPSLYMHVLLTMDLVCAFIFLYACDNWVVVGIGVPFKLPFWVVVIGWQLGWANSKWITMLQSPNLHFCTLTLLYGKKLWK